MKTFFNSKPLALLFFFLIYCFSGSAQLREINLSKQTEFGSPNSIEHFDVIEDGSGNTFHLGSSYHSSEKYNMLLTKFDINDNVEWSVEIDNNSQNDYGVSVALTPNGDIYVAGATVTSTNRTEVFLAKVDEYGVVSWTGTHSRAYSLQHYPTRIICRDNSNFYLASSNQMQNSGMDISITEFDDQGNPGWEKHYDKAGYNDQGIEFEFDLNNDLSLVGIAQNSSEDYGILTLDYDVSGSQLSSSFTTYNTTMEKVNKVMIDGKNNKYFVGYKISTNDGRDICVAKLDSQNTFKWIKTFDYEGNNDVAMDVGIDESDKIYILGYGENADGGSDLLLLKYDSLGNSLDTIEYAMVNRNDILEGHKLLIANGRIHVGGTRYDAGSSKTGFITMVFESTGELVLSKHWTDGDDEASGVANLSVEIGSNEVSLYGFTNNITSGSGTYLLLKYEWIVRDLNVATLTHPVIDYADNELVIEVAPERVKTDFANNTDILFGELSQALDSIALDSIDDKIGELTSFENMRIIKINPEFTTADTLSLARTGKWIPLEPLYNQFVLLLEGTNTETSLANKLNELDMVNFCEINSIPELLNIPDDPELKTNDEQASLVPTSTYPNTHIGMDEAWDIEVGDTTIKVGVFDSGTQWLHKDLAPGGQGDPDKSKCTGYDFENKKYFFEHDNSFKFDAGDHGTAVSGIIGATRNNAFGVAGVAGGDWADGENSGCHLTIARLSKRRDTAISSLPTSSYTTALYKFGLKTNTGKGEGVHVMNHSYNIGLSNWPFDHDSIPTINRNYAKAFHRAARNGVVQVAARGNLGNSVVSYPACYDDSWVINVGGYTDDRDVHPDASFGKGVDLIGPMDEDHIATLRPYTLTQIDYNFNGTSAAAPHVSGVAALVLSQFNNKSPLYENLSGEDIEYLLQKYTFASNCSSYPDPKCGWGALNAKEVMEHMEYPYYRIDHFPKSGTSPTLGIKSSAGTVTLKFTEKWKAVPKGSYTATASDVIVNFTHSIRPADQLLGSWLRANFCSGLQLQPITTSPIVIPNIEGGQLLTCTKTTASIKVRIYEFSHNHVSYTYPDEWQRLDYSYGVHLYDSNATPADFFTEITEEDLKTKLRVYPNPSKNIINVSFKLAQAHEVKIRLLDIRGVEVLSLDNKLYEVGRYREQMDISGLTKGIYLIEFTSNHQRKVRRIVKD